MQLELTRPTALLTRGRLTRQPRDAAPVVLDEPELADEPEGFDDLTIPEAIAPPPLDVVFDEDFTRACELALAATRRRRRRGRPAVVASSGTRADTPRARRGRGLVGRLLALLVATVRAALHRNAVLALQSADHSHR